MRRGLALRAAAGVVTATVVTLVTVVAGSSLPSMGVAGTIPGAGVVGRGATGTGVAASPGPGGVGLTVLAVTLALWPEYTLRPRRPLDRLRAAASRVWLAIGALAFAGFLGISLVPAPVLLAVVGVTTAVVVPILLSEFRRVARPQRIVVAGDDAGKLGDAVDALETSPLGHVSPPRLSLSSAAPDSLDVDRLRTDGGVAPQEEEERGTETREDATRNEEQADDVREKAAGQPKQQAAVEQNPSTASGDRNAVERPTTERISGLSRLQNVLVSSDVDTVILGFSASDRQEFFGALRVCRDHGIDAKVHAFHAPATLLHGDRGAPSRNRNRDEPLRGDAETDGGSVTSDVGGEPGELSTVRGVGNTNPDATILDANVEPLPLHSRIAKRAFDVCFALFGLVVLAPLVLVIAVAIRLDSPGPVLYGQRRTARLGRVFRLSKFRSMTDGAERDTGPTLSDEDVGDVDARVTRVGNVLRTTHLDEIPQLLSVLTGDMTVVGPRPERPELEAEITDSGIEWERRWFVKPGLTGLAQINDVTGFQPAEKLAYDLEYVERQSLALDVRIVLEQLRLVFADALALLRSGETE